MNKSVLKWHLLILRILSCSKSWMPQKHHSKYKSPHASLLLTSESTGIKSHHYVMFLQNDYIINCSLYQMTIQETHSRLSQTWQILSHIVFSIFKHYYWEALSAFHWCWYFKTTYFRFTLECGTGKMLVTVLPHYPFTKGKQTSLSFCWITKHCLTSQTTKKQ